MRRAEPIERPSMVYIAPENFKLTYEQFQRTKLAGYCRNCGEKIQPVERPSAFYMNAGYGFKWIVDQKTCCLCEACFNDLREHRELKGETGYVTEKVVPVGKYRGTFQGQPIDYEIIESDPYGGYE